MVYLHSKDDYRPDVPMTFIRSSDLKWSHQPSVVGACPGEDHIVAAKDMIDASRLGEASATPYSHHPSDHTKMGCPDYTNGNELKTSDYTRPFDGSKRDNILGELEGYNEEGFFLDADDDDNELRSGIGTRAPVFYEYVKGKYVTYWFFYPYDDFTYHHPS